MKKFFSRKYSKIQIINSILSALKKSGSSTDKLIIHTSNGIYQGVLKKPINFSDTTVTENDDILTCFDKMYQSSLAAYENSEDSKNNIEISENSLTIELEDVDVFTSLKKVKMPFAIIFVDQIIGFSIGHME
jgi:hypothetical protein